MHYYQFHIGDYKSHTHHLSLIEDLAYRRLLDHYYLHEAPIKQRDIARQIGMRDYEQEVLTILDEFFVSAEDGFIHPRADAEIAKFKEFAEAGKRGAAKRWAKAGDGEANNPPNAPPIATINHKPITNNQDTYICPPTGEPEAKDGLPSCPHQAVVDLYHQHLPTLRRVEVWNSARQGYLRQRWREVAAELAQEKQIDRQELHHVLRLERDLLPVLADMSWGGIRVDIQAAQAAIPVLDEKEARLQHEIQTLVGGKFNVNSSPQIREFFKPEPINRFQWRLIDGTLFGPTKAGKGPSIDQHALREIKHPLAALILDLRKTIKLRDTFLRGHILGSADDNGYVHTNFNQTRNDADAGTVTGRLSSTDPALQQITKRDKANAAILRACFLADEGDEWLCEDYSQVDFRCGAHLQNDPDVIEAYRSQSELDYHQVVSDMTGIPRNPPYAGAPNTKQINLGLSFGAGPGKLAFMMGMPHEVKEYKGKMAYVPGDEAKEIFDLYHNRLPAVKQFMKRAENVAKTTGYVKTQIGRRLRFPRGVGAHKAAGLLYQAYAADLHKYGLVMVDRLIRSGGLSEPARLMMSCHDEIGVSTKRDERNAEMIRLAYTNFNSEDSPIRMRVPIMASVDFGANWYEASK